LRLGDQMDEQSRDYIERVRKNGATLAILLKKIQEFSLYSDGAPVVSVDLNRVLSDVRSELAQLLESSNATLSSNSLPRVTGREAGLRRVLLELIKNAVQHRGENSPVIRVQAVSNPSHLTVTVNDNGPGVPDHLSESIFRIFPRKDTGEPSTGIGLA